MLANLVAFRLDRRLRGLAQACGARYTRYADDLAFSGDRAFERMLEGFMPRAAAIAIEEGFVVRFRKTRVMRAAQRQELAGLVINRHPNLRRSDYDALRALLHNAGKTGLGAQNREGHPHFREHIAGRIAWVRSTNEARGQKLLSLFEQLP